MLALAFAFVATTGCATVLKPQSDRITVTSMTPGAQILVDGMPMAVTPAQIPLSTKSDHLITVRGARGEQTCHITSHASVGWILLDVVMTPAWIVDLATDSWSSLDHADCMTGI
jgi:hypothetical protein